MATPQGKILVVEDEPDALVIVTSFLKGAGYLVVPAYGGEDALRKLGREEFDLIVTDLAMPDVSGLRVISTIKDDPERRHIPIIAVTGFSAWDTITQSAGDLGCDAIVLKPIDGKLLLRKVAEQLGQSRRSKKTP